MKKNGILILFILTINFCFGQYKLDSLIETKVFKLTYEHMVNDKPIWFNGKKYNVVGLYCLFKDKNDEIQYKKVNANTELNNGYILFRFSEIYLTPFSSKGSMISSNFKDGIIVEIYDLISSEKRKLSTNDNMTLLKRADGKYYYQTYDTPYTIVINGVKSPKIYDYSILESMIKKSSVSKKQMKIITKNNKIIKIDRTTFLRKNGITL